MTSDRNSSGTGRHRRRRTDLGPVTGSFIPGDLTGEFTGKFTLPSHLHDDENVSQDAEQVRDIPATSKERATSSDESDAVFVDSFSPGHTDSSEQDSHVSRAFSEDQSPGRDSVFYSQGNEEKNLPSYSSTPQSDTPADKFLSFHSDAPDNQNPSYYEKVLRPEEYTSVINTVSDSDADRITEKDDEVPGDIFSDSRSALREEDSFATGGYNLTPPQCDAFSNEPLTRPSSPYLDTESVSPPDTAEEKNETKKFIYSSAESTFHTDEHGKWIPPGVLEAQEKANGATSDLTNSQSTVSTDTGRHRTLSKEKNRRGIAAWPVILGIFAVFVVILVVAWMTLSDHLDKRKNQALVSCASSKHIAVNASPVIADPLRKIVADYNGTHPKQGEYCYTFDVKVLNSSTSFKNLISLSQAQEKPQIWVPDSSLYVAALKASNPKLVLGNSASLASSPAVLAVQKTATGQLHRLGWADLPSTQVNHGLDAFGMNEWASLKIALPVMSDFSATYLTLASIAASAAHHEGKVQASFDKGVLRNASLIPTAKEKLKTILSNRPQLKIQPYNVHRALSILSAQKKDEVNALHSLPVLESQLFQFVKAHPDAHITEVVPQDFTSVADFPAQVIAKSSGDQEALNSLITYIVKSRSYHHSLAAHGLRDAQFTQEFLDLAGKNTPILQVINIKGTPFPHQPDPKASQVFLATINKLRG